MNRLNIINKRQSLYSKFIYNRIVETLFRKEYAGRYKESNNYLNKKN